MGKGKSCEVGACKSNRYEEDRKSLFSLKKAPEKGQNERFFDPSVFPFSTVLKLDSKETWVSREISQI